MSRPPRIADEDQPAPRALLGDAQQHIDRVGDYVEKCERVGLPDRAAELRDTQRTRDPEPSPPTVDDKTADLFEDGTPKPATDAATNGEAHDPDDSTADGQEPETAPFE
jgi:hypothetical protein